TAIAAILAGTLNVGMIPDANPSRLVRDSQPLVSYLEQQTGAKIQLTVPTNYAAVVEALVAGKLDLAYLGGFTYVQARKRAGVIPLVQRTIDADFHSLFITQPSSGIETLQDLKGKTFAFGDVNSTSGRLMPTYFLHANGLPPLSTFKSFIFSGGHDATALAVANGKVDAGALDETWYRKLLDKGIITEKQVRVFWTTPGFPDYVWVAAKNLPPQTAAKLKDAYLRLDPAQPDDKVLLDLLRADKFVTVEDKKYDRLRDAAYKEGLLR
ncbi:MAG: putative selenate ABC transporter substrate-binding protein, partial [Candidatus Sericytochromatia bacterium]|nr:putative selenate ABC transporter substrate-binding protein [Candidatus Tanganyikabacteria bacterium]